MVAYVQQFWSDISNQPFHIVIRYIDIMKMLIIATLIYGYFMSNDSF